MESKMADKQTDVTKQPDAAKGTSLAPWESFRTEFDQLFNRFSRGMSPWRSAMLGDPRTALAGWLTAPLPTVDIAEDAAAYTIAAELPGLTAADVDVSLDKDYLVLKGEKHDERKREEKNYHLTERSYGAFERSFLLPEGVDRDKIKAEFANGVLTVTLPKTAIAKEPAKKIEVKPT
jgi:HSP20 family protein